MNEVKNDFVIPVKDVVDFLNLLTSCDQNLMNNLAGTIFLVNQELTNLGILETLKHEGKDAVSIIELFSCLIRQAGPRYFCQCCAVKAGCNDKLHIEVDQKTGKFNFLLEDERLKSPNIVKLKKD
jgi:hypothetical protein